MNDITLLLTFQTQSTEKKAEREQDGSGFHSSFLKSHSKKESISKVGMCYKPEELLKGIQIILTGHNDAEDVPPDVRVHALFACQLQHFGTELRDEQ